MFSRSFKRDHAETAMRVFAASTCRRAVINHFLSPALYIPCSLRQWILKQQLKRNAVNSTDARDILLLKQALYDEVVRQLDF